MSPMKEVVACGRTEKEIDKQDEAYHYFADKLKNWLKI
jgi:hypothetical protein